MSFTTVSIGATLGAGIGDTAWKNQEHGIRCVHRRRKWWRDHIRTSATLSMKRIISPHHLAIPRPNETVDLFYRHLISCQRRPQEVCWNGDSHRVIWVGTIHLFLYLLRRFFSFLFFSLLVCFFRLTLRLLRPFALGINFSSRIKLE